MTSSKPKYRWAPEEEDMEYETEVTRNPFHLKSWLSYISFKSTSKSADAAISTDIIRERAVRALPGSYKLWHSYLDSRVRRLRASSSEASRTAVVSLFERSLVTMHKMPRIWLDYARFLRGAGHITATRHVLDRALQALPVAQHEMVWREYRAFIGDESVPRSTAARVLRRYVTHDPGAVEDLVDALAAEGLWLEAATRLATAVATHGFQSRRGKSRRQMWADLCAMITRHPREVGGKMDVEGIIRDGAARAAKESEPGEAGDLWSKLAEFYARMNHFERARDVLEEALGTVTTVADFSVVWDAYTAFEDNVIAATIEASQRAGITREDREEAEADLALRMARYEDLIARHALLVNAVALRQNPHNVHEWFKRVKIVEERVRLGEATRATIAETFTQALRAVDPQKAKGKPHLLWAAFARFNEEAGLPDRARKVFEKGVEQPFKCVDDLASLWCEYVEMEIRHGNYGAAKQLCERATAKPTAALAASSVQRWVHRSIKLWCLYIDLEESFGSLAATKAAYERTIELRIATPQLVINYAAMLEERGYFEDSFRAYERGVALFDFPHAMPLWVTYLTKFIARYGGRKLERARDLFEQVLSKVPPEDAKVFYVMYANLEEEYGLARHAMAVYDRATRAVAESDRYAMFLLYAARAGEFFGVMKTREVYERAVRSLPERFVRDASIRFAALELKLGEVDRARAIYTHCAQFCNPLTDPKFWDLWREFEVQHGNNDTFHEMLRVRRSVQASYNTTVNVAAIEMIQAAQSEKKRAGSSMEQLERESKIEDAAQQQQPQPKKGHVEFTKAAVPEVQQFPSQQTKQTASAADPDALDLDEGPAPAKKIVDVEQQPVPQAVFGGLAAVAAASTTKEEKQLGALERLKRAGKV